MRYFQRSHLIWSRLLKEETASLTVKKEEIIQINDFANGFDKS